MANQHQSNGRPDNQQRPNEVTDANDDGVIVPGSPPPIGTERTDVNPGDEAGVDELPSNDGEVPLDTNDEAVLQDELPDVDIDSAELDDAPDPR